MRGLSGFTDTRGVFEIDEAGGEIVVIEQSGLVDAGKIRIDPTEWPAIRAAIDRMIEECRPINAIAPS